MMIALEFVFTDIPACVNAEGLVVFDKQHPAAP